MANLTPDYEVSAALDFGTTYCGIAYSLKVDYQKNPLSFYAEQKNKGEDPAAMQKPTTVLVDSDCKFLSFGEEAEKMYALKLVNNETNVFLYRHFKMRLHGKQELTKYLEIEDITGKKKMRAQTLFKIAIEFWIKRLKELLDKRGCKIEDDKIRWVITVPGMWSEKARQYMREAAEEAGIDGRNLLLVYEPEAAAVLCKTESVQKQSGRLLKGFDPGTTFLVVDMGGGTVDTTVQKVQEKGFLTSLKSASGGPFGGNEVNQSFFDFVRKIVGVTKLQEFKQYNAAHYLDFERNFEQEKKKIDFESGNETTRGDVNSDDKILIPLPRDFDETEMSKSIEASKFSKDAKVSSGYLQLSKNLMRTFFDRTVGNIEDHVESVIAEISACKSILLVGGFAASPYVENRLKKKFENSTRKVFVPAEAGNAVLHGAVVFGHNPSVISERVSPFTYGLKTRVAYTNRYPIERRKQVGEKFVVEGIFQKHITVGEVVRIGESLRGFQFNVIDKNNRAVFWDVYKSTLEDPLFCEENLGSTHIGRLEITLEGKVDKDRKLRVKMTCRGTELEADAFDEDTKKHVQTKLNFLI